MSKFAGLELEVETKVRVPITHPVTRQPLRNEQGAEAYIELHSADSEAAETHQQNVARRRLAMRGRMKITPEELTAEGTEFLVALTSGWLLVSLDGSPMDVPFSSDNARELYAARSMAWLREQVEEAVADRQNFTRSSSKS